MSKEELTLSDWIYQYAPDWIYKGSGTRGAFEYGFRAELGGKELGNVYFRADCVRAESLGRTLASRIVDQQKTVIVCDCCQQPFSRTPRD
jgi:hypothetical protein